MKDYVTIYKGDVGFFSMDDWEDLFLVPAFPASSTWEGWNAMTEERLELEDTPETRELPTRKILFVMDRERGEPIEWSRPLRDLLEDMEELMPAKKALYSSLSLRDEELDGQVGVAAYAFAEAYDGAMARALFMMVKEAYGKED